MRTANEALVRQNDALVAQLAERDVGIICNTQDTITDLRREYETLVEENLRLVEGLQATDEVEESHRSHSSDNDADDDTMEVVQQVQVLTNPGIVHGLRQELAHK